MWFDRYLFSPTGIYQISGDFAPYNQPDPGNQFSVQSNSQWFWVYGNTGYFIHGMSTYETRIVLSSVNLITGDATWGLATVVGPTTQAQEGVCPTCVLYGNYMYAFEPINYEYEYIQVYRVDLTNIAAGFTEVIPQTTGYLWAARPPSIALASLLPVQCFLDGNNVYLSLVDSFSVISFLKFTINPSTYSITEDPINPRFNIFNNRLSGHNLQNHMFVMNGRRYTMISDTQSIQSALLDITDLNNIQKLSTLPGVKALCQMYTSNNSYYIIDTSSYVYLINNPNNPLLVSSFFPQIDDTKNPYILQINNDIVIGIVSSPSPNLWVTPFVSAPVTLNSIHYNLNIDASYDASSLATIQVVNLTDYPYLCELKGNRIYVKNIITKKIAVPVKYVGININFFLKQILNENFEGKCSAEGYVKYDSCKIITYSCGTVTGNLAIFTVVIEYLVCNPSQGMRISCEVKNITNAGIIARIDDSKYSPINIFIARDHHYNIPYFSELKEGDSIMIKVIGNRFELNDKFVSVLGKLELMRERESRDSIRHEIERSQKEKGKGGLGLG
jgi:DNA-directed RNA polymerase subunit E'/Rpb7